MNIQFNYFVNKTNEIALCLWHISAFVILHFNLNFA